MQMEPLIVAYWPMLKAKVPFPRVRKRGGGKKTNEKNKKQPPPNKLR